MKVIKNIDLISSESGAEKAFVNIGNFKYSKFSKFSQN